MAEIEYDPDKRTATLERRGLDFDDAARLFEAPHLSRIDDRFDYGEVRYNTLGLIGDVVVALTWTQRDGLRRIISLRRANEGERRAYATFAR